MKPWINLFIILLWLGCGVRHSTYSESERDSGDAAVDGDESIVEDTERDETHLDARCPSDIQSLEGLPCSEEEENLRCSFGDCSDPCSFCNIVACLGGTWQRLEAFPLPCFQCGEIQCISYEEYCFVMPQQDGNHYRCYDLEGCSCDCWTEYIDNHESCVELAPGEIVVTFLGP